MYAENTSVSIVKSRMEIERIIEKYGATQFVSGWQSEKAVIGFTMCGRQIKFIIKTPAKADFTHNSRGRERTSEAAYTAWEQGSRQKWRALFLVIKAKLEAVESDISVFEDEFMAHIVLPDGKTVSEFMRPQIAVAYDTGNMPALLPHLTD